MHEKVVLKKRQRSIREAMAAAEVGSKFGSCGQSAKSGVVRKGLQSAAFEECCRRASRSRNAGPDVRLKVSTEIGLIFQAHFFWVNAFGLSGFFEARLESVLTNWQGVVERTVEGLGYDLVDAERSVGGLLRVYIDHAYPSAMVDPVATVLPDSNEPAVAFITVDDCEKVTRQLQHVLEVEGCAYERLEVSSPGLDRPLKKAGDYARFVGEQVAIVLKVPFQGRKKFHGELHPSGDGWRLLLAVDLAASGKSGRPPKPTPVDATAPNIETTRALDFSLDEVLDAHLVPVLDFKGRRFAAPEAAPAAEVHPDDEIEGDPSQ